MATSIPFVKYSGNGNDFIIIANDPSLSQRQIQEMCHRTFGVGADGVLLLGRLKDADAQMKIFNSDGLEAEMCANGLRCLTAHVDHLAASKKNTYVIQTMHARYNVRKINHNFEVEMAEIKDQNLFDFTGLHPFKESFYVNTGVPHLVFLVDDASSIDVKVTGFLYRNHWLLPNGANVSFVEVLKNKVQAALVRTYERGVEDETYSCGTGLTASALALSEWFDWKDEIYLYTKGGKQTVTLGERVLYSGEIKFCFSGTWNL